MSATLTRPTRSASTSPASCAPTNAACRFGFRTNAPSTRAPTRDGYVQPASRSRQSTPHLLSYGVRCVFTTSVCAARARVAHRVCVCLSRSRSSDRRVLVFVILIASVDLLSPSAALRGGDGGMWTSSRLVVVVVVEVEEFGGVVVGVGGGRGDNAHFTSSTNGRW